jgi:hypothetical protein
MNRILMIFFIPAMLFYSAAYSAPTNAKTAITEASNNNQFLLLAFYEDKDADFIKMSSTADEFAKASAIKTIPYYAKMEDTANRELAGQYGIKNKKDLPLLLIIAPNGAITGGFPKAVTADQLKQCVSLSDLVIRTLKPLQSQKLVLVTLQNKTTKFNAESQKGVNDFASDPQYSQFTEVVKADPSDAGSADFLKQCGLISPLTEASVVVLLPPGKIGKILNGKITKADLVSALHACTAGGSCGTGGCSDQRYKKDVATIESPLDKVSKLNGVTFIWDRENYPHKLFPEGRKTGFIAQEVESVLPEVVNTDNEGYKSVEYDKITALLVEAVKELENKIKKQDAVIEEQGKRIKELEALKNK